MHSGGGSDILRQQRSVASTGGVGDCEMRGITRRDGQLYIEELSASSLAMEFGTPCYVYSKDVLLESAERIRSSFSRSSPRFFYAVKANGNLSVLKLLRELGFGFDIVSSGEMSRAILAGARGEELVFSGVGKSTLEIETALSMGVGCFNVESESEMLRLESISSSQNRKARMALRVSPGIDGGTHRHLTTGTSEGKFGVSYGEALSLSSRASESSWLEFLGFACHIGSQIRDASAYMMLAEKMSKLVGEARELGLSVSHVDMGGGFGVDYETSGGLNIDLSEYDACLSELFTGVEVWLEPGRSIAASSGVLLTQVEYVKRSGGNLYWIVDAGMNDIMRPALYDAVHVVESTLEKEGEGQTGIVAGPVCESADIIARGCRLNVEEGDVLAVRDAGAYCSAMSSNYNARPRPPEVLVDGKTARLIRRRETYEDMLAAEKSLLHNRRMGD